MNTPGDPNAIIALDIGSRGNLRLLERVLAGDYRLLPHAGDRPADAADLTVVDPAALARREAEFRQARAQAAPVILPIVLLAERRDLATGLVERHLGRTVDDVIRIPTTGAELRTRIDNLLRLRRLAREQYARHQVTEEALRGTTRALHALNAGNEVLVRVQDEDELLDAICRIIIEEGQYPLAWVGFRRGEDAADQTDIEVRSAAGPASPRIAAGMANAGPIRRALETGGTQAVPDLHAEPVLRPFADARADTLASALLLPVVPQTGRAGVLAIYSRSTGGFSDEERDLLERLAANLRVGVGTIRADQDRERQRTEIHELAFSDPLTGLSNRTHLIGRLDELLGRGEAVPRLAVLFVDLDRFKLVNDALGHVAGDEVLRQVSHRLANTVRGSDLVARQGGDEFIVVMTEGPRAGNAAAESDSAAFTGAACDLAAHVARTLREPLAVHGYERRVDVSVGISLYPDHGQDAATLIDQADTAMYEAKLGRSSGIAVYRPAMSHERRQRLSLEARLHHAIEHHELELHYQPMVELGSGCITGAEALLRWPQDDGSLVAPADFIPVAEETGLIGRIGEWVLDTAARQIAEWRTQSLAVPIAVNLSPRQIRAPGDHRHLAEVVSAHVEPAWIELEVTESALMADPESTEATLRAFNEHGFRLAVDDFGTGYSSLSRLRSLPIQTLKIDKAFIADMGRTSSGAGIVHTIIELARSLSMRPLAEGIETDRQRGMLLDEGCERGQGYWFSQPLPADALARLIAQGQRAWPRELTS